MRVFLYCFFLVALTFSSNAFAQTLDWANKTTNTTSDHSYIQDVTADASGNVYAIGRFESAIDVDGDLVADMTNPSASNDAVFLIKYNDSGVPQWYFPFLVVGGASGPNSTCYGESITTDQNGNIYVMGTINGTNIDFDPLGSSSVVLSSGGTRDIFVAKYNPSGHCQWAFLLTDGGISNQQGYAIDVDDFGNLYITGAFRNTIDFDPGVGTSTLVGNGSSYDGYLAKYDTNGIYQWAFLIGSAGSGSDYVQDVAVDSNGDVYITGTFDPNGGTIDFDPLGGGGYNLTSENSSVDFFIAKYNSSGNCQWAYSFGEPGATTADYSYGIAVDPLNNIYITGRTEGNVDFDPSVGTALFNASTTLDDAFLASYTTAGAFRWLARIGDSGTSVCYGYSVTATASYVYVSARMDGSGAGIQIYDATSNSSAVASNYSCKCYK